MGFFCNTIISYLSVSSVKHLKTSQGVQIIYLSAPKITQCNTVEKLWKINFISWSVIDRDRVLILVILNGLYSSFLIQPSWTVQTSLN